MPTLESRQKMSSSPNQLPFPFYSSWPAIVPTFYNLAPSIHQRRTLAVSHYANQSSQINFRYRTQTGSGKGAKRRASGEDSFRVRPQATNGTFPLLYDIPEMTSCQSNCDINSCRPLFPLRPPGSAYRSNYPHSLLPGCGGVLSSGCLRLPDCAQFDSSDVADVEPAELDQYLDRKSASPSGGGSENAHTAIHVSTPLELRISDPEEIAVDPLPTILSPHSLLQAANCVTESSNFFDDGFSNSRPNNLTDNIASERVYQASSPSTFLEDLTGTGEYSSWGINGRPDDPIADICSSTTSSFGHSSLEDELRFSPVRIPRRGEGRADLFTDSFHELLTSPPGDFDHYASVSTLLV